MGFPDQRQSDDSKTTPTYSRSLVRSVLMSRKASTFRVTAHPIITGQHVQNHNPWAWLHSLTVERWEELIQANLDEQGGDDSVFYVLKPGSDDVLECPREIALQAYEDVLAGKTTPSGPGPLASATIKKLQTAGGSRMRASASESFM